MRRVLVLMMLLLAGAWAAEPSGVDHSQQAAQLADANNKLLRRMADEGFLTEDRMAHLLSGQYNATMLGVKRSGDMCVGAAAYVDSEFQWMKIAQVAGSAAFVLAVFIVWDRMARRAFNTIQPGSKPGTLVINGVEYRRVR